MTHFEKELKANNTNENIYEMAERKSKEIKNCKNCLLRQKQECYGFHDDWGCYQKWLWWLLRKCEEND